VTRRRQDSQGAPFRAPWRVFTALVGVCWGAVALVPLDGCTLNLTAKEGSLLTVRGGNVSAPVAQPVGTNGVATVGAEPKSATEWVIYVLIAVATAVYPLVIRPIRRWLEKRNGNGAPAQ